MLGCDRLVYSESCKWKGKYILMFHRYVCSVLFFSNGSSVHNSAHTWIRKSHNYRYAWILYNKVAERTSAFSFCTVKGFVGSQGAVIKNKNTGRVQERGSEVFKTCTRESRLPEVMLSVLQYPETGHCIWEEQIHKHCPEHSG